MKGESRKRQDQVRRHQNHLGWTQVAPASTLRLLREAFTVGAMRFRGLGKSDWEFGSKSQSLSCLGFGGGGWVRFTAGKLSAPQQSVTSLALCVEEREMLLLSPQHYCPGFGWDRINSLLVASTVLCFGFSVRILLITL